MKAHFQYLRYVVRHKWFVLVAGLKVGAPLWRLLIHDWSKFVPVEWSPYVQKFYGQPRVGEVVAGVADNAAFERAWLHHLHANPHHWQHWILQEESGATKALRMSTGLVREMVADWMGAGRAITGRWEVAEWYAKNRDKMLLHPETRAAVEALLTPTEGGTDDGE